MTALLVILMLVISYLCTSLLFWLMTLALYVCFSIVVTFTWGKAFVFWLLCILVKKLLH